MLCGLNLGIDTQRHRPGCRPTLEGTTETVQYIRTAMVGKAVNLTMPAVRGNGHKCVSESCLCGE